MAHTSRKLAVSAKGLTKRYRISSGLVQHNTLGEAMLHRARNPLARAKTEEFEALSDINFDIECGEVVGIIGRNGAGKSTLLKVLSQITEPTTGEINLYGRIGSLLEVGTGFHPELTGRENIFLNGSILGMSRREIQSEFDNIVEFSGVAKFLDTPVKRYSSGMYIRLAFAVAAHLRTEILVVDEVLSVGDAEFQAKCLGKMKDVATDGRTVLFVSHQMQSVRTLCTSGIYLEKGRLTYQGDVIGAIERYMDSFSTKAASLSPYNQRRGSGELRITALTPDKEIYRPADHKTIRFAVQKQREAPSTFFVTMIITNEIGVHIMQGDSRMANRWFETKDYVEGFFSFTTPWLKPGRYTVSLYVCNAGIIDSVDGAASFDVLPILPYNAPANDEAMRESMILADFACGLEGEPVIYSSETMKTTQVD
jgi:lipopolysaccharide transport system ATP-binding protein